MKKSLGARTLVYPTPVFVVGTYDPAGKPNVMTASWGGVCCSEPPAIAVSLRKATSSYENIRQRKAFTINLPSESLVRQADYFGLVSGRNANKLATAKLTPIKSKNVDAPYIKEFPVVLECKLIHMIDLGMHTQFIGEIVDALVEDEILGSDGAIDIRKLQPLIYTPETQEYYGIGEFVAKVFVGNEL